LDSLLVSHSKGLADPLVAVAWMTTQVTFRGNEHFLKLGLGLGMIGGLIGG
jgi:hypothetical protein